MKRFSTLVIAIFVASMLFLALPIDADAQALCCQNPTGCFDNGGSGPLPTACLGDLIAQSSCDMDTDQCVQMPSSIPTLSEMGSIAVALVLGIAALIILHRRKKASI